MSKTDAPWFPIAAGGRLTFADLRKANLARLPVFKNKHGEPAHSKPDGSDWSPAQWLGAVIGELGEYANFRKKYERGDMTFDEFEVVAAKELADVQTYLDILALRCLDQVSVAGVYAAHPTGIDLGQATIDKFNEVSRRVGADVWLQQGIPTMYTNEQLREALVASADEALALRKERDELRAELEQWREASRKGLCY